MSKPLTLVKLITLVALAITTAEAFSLGGCVGRAAAAARGRPLAATTATAKAVEVPVVTVAGGGAVTGTTTLALRTTRSGNDAFVVHRKLVKERRDMRQGTASTKTRSEVSGGGRKPYAQKGTGNARRGSSRSPLIRGGGVIFGPKPKDWANKKMNKKEARLAVGLAIQNKAGISIVVDDLEAALPEPKTKAMAALLATLGAPKELHTLLVLDVHDELFYRAGRNIPTLKVLLKDQLNVYDCLRSQRIIYARGAFEFIKAKFSAPERYRAGLVVGSGGGGGGGGGGGSSSNEGAGTAPLGAVSSSSLAS